MTTSVGSAATPVLADLNDQWARLNDRLESPSDVDELLAQLAREEAYAGHVPADLDEVLALVAESPDPRLAVLVRLGQSGSQMAVRVVVQAFLGRVVTLAARYASTDFEHQVTHGVSVLWNLVVAYPLARRPKVAANLAMDLLKHMDRPSRRELPAGDLRDDLIQSPSPGTTGPTADRLLAGALSEGILDHDAARLLARIYLREESYAAIAADTGLSQPALRKRASRAIAALRAHAPLLAA